MARRILHALLAVTLHWSDATSARGPRPVSWRPGDLASYCTRLASGACAWRHDLGVIRERVRSRFLAHRLCVSWCYDAHDARPRCVSLDLHRNPRASPEGPGGPVERSMRGADAWVQAMPGARDVPRDSSDATPEATVAPRFVLLRPCALRFEERMVAAIGACRCSDTPARSSC